MVAAMMPAMMMPATMAKKGLTSLKRLAMVTMMVSASASSPILPAETMAEPTTPMKMATAIEMNTQVVATRREICSLFSSSMAMKRSRIWGIPK